MIARGRFGSGRENRKHRAADDIGALAFGAGVDAADPLWLLALIPAGALSYCAAAWLLDIGGLRSALRSLPQPIWRINRTASLATPVDNHSST
jgi:hypothetical protein